MNYEVLILARQKSCYSSLLAKFFKKQNIEVKQILDNPIEDKIKDGIRCYDDKPLILEGFVNFQSGWHWKHIKNPAAWEKSFYYLEQEGLKHDYYWFMEDDVFCNNFNIFIEFFNKLNSDGSDLVTSYVHDDSSRWNYWDDDIFYPPGKRFRSINCISRLSKELVQKVLDMRRQAKTFVFHESMFIGACKNNGMPVTDFIKDVELSKIFYNYDIYPSIGRFPNDRITHSVKPYGHKLNTPWCNG